MTTPEGKHLIVELLGCDYDLLNSVENVERVLVAAAKRINTTVLKTYFHQFEPQGVTGVVVIEESHLTCHAWSELGYNAVDIFTCGQTDPREALGILKEGFNAQEVSCVVLNRGRYIPNGSTKIDLETWISPGKE